MITFADNSTRQAVWDMWKEVFGDSDEYMELYFRTKYSNDNTLLRLVEGVPVASLQMLPYGFTFCGREIPVSYLSGVSTLEAHRKRGYMDELMVHSLNVAYERQIPLMLLVPQEEWLLRFYDKYGFAQTFDPGDKEMTLLGDMKELIETDPKAAYRKFDAVFRNRDVTIQKTFEDFCAVTEEGKLFGYPSKRSLIGMARVIDAEYLLSVFASYYSDISFCLRVNDPILAHNNACFCIDNGVVRRRECDSDGAFQFFEVDINMLARLLLGYHTEGLTTDLSALFPEKTPGIHYMME